jgi:hypothetical protein
MSDARFTHNSPGCDVDLIVALLEIYSDCVAHLQATFRNANVLKTDEARLAYLDMKNYLGVSVRLEFISYMKQQGTYFDVEEAIKAIQCIHQFTKPQLRVVE